MLDPHHVRRLDAVTANGLIDMVRLQRKRHAGLVHKEGDSSAPHGPDSDAEEEVSAEDLKKRRLGREQREPISIRRPVSMGSTQIEHSDSTFVSALLSTGAGALKGEIHKNIATEMHHQVALLATPHRLIIGEEHIIFYCSLTACQLIFTADTWLFKSAPASAPCSGGCKQAVGRSSRGKAVVVGPEALDESQLELLQPWWPKLRRRKQPGACAAQAI